VGVVAIKKPVHRERESNKKPISILHHYAAIHHKKYKHQPMSNDMGKITNDLKRIGHTKRHSTQQLLQSLSSGQCVMLSNFEVDIKNNIRFLSSSAFAIDVDDDNQSTNPIEVLHDLKDICTGLFYTFSHGKKGNRYRLFFQLDEPITKQDELKALIDYMIFHLKDKGLPVDAAAKSPTQVIRPGISGYEVNDLSTTLKVSQWLPKAKVHAAQRFKALEQQRKKRAEQLDKDLLNPVTFEELKAMCESIGYISSGNGDDSTNKWLQIVYALKNEVESGVLDEIQGYELYSIISGDEANDRYWNGIKPYGHVTVGTIIHHATEAGYKRKHKYSYSLQETHETIAQEHLKVKEYLTPEIAKTLIQRKQRLLIDSPTGSRKTSSFMAAFKELANIDYHFYIFAAPTIPLTEQVAKDHGVPCITGGMKNLRNDVTNKAVRGERIFVTTYDKTAELIHYLSDGISYGKDKPPEFTIVIDEVHKFTEAYNYRFAAIDQLEQLTNMATSVIGLSGTPEDILKDNFDVLIKIETGNKKSPCLDYRVFTYSTKTGEKRTKKTGKVEEETNKNLADVMLLQVIKGLLKQTKVLVFINNKERIQTISKLLKKENVNTQVVTSDTKQSSTYLNIVESGKINDEVQVVLSTAVLADGISINNSLNWSCVVVADKASPIFNPSTIKQISNRFRKDYRYFILFMREPNPDYAETKPFRIETDYKYRKRVVTEYVNYLNEEFEGELLQEFTPSKVERHNGIYYRSTDENATIEFNPLFVRHQAMKRKESYFGTFRHAFINEVGKQIGLKCKAIINVNEDAKKNDKDFSELLADMDAEQEQKKKTDAELRSAFSQYFDESIYNCFVRDDEEALKLFKKDIHPNQYKSMLKVCHIADYETCKRIGENIKKDADTHKYYNDIQTLVDIATFEHVKKSNLTKRVFNELVKITEKTYSTKDFKKLTEQLLPKKLKVQPTDVKEALKLFHKIHTRTGGESFTLIKVLSVELVANLRHSPSKENMEVGHFYGIGEQKVKNSILKYVWSKNAHQQKILLPAVVAKWGIENYEIQ